MSADPRAAAAAYYQALVELAQADGGDGLAPILRDLYDEGHEAGVEVGRRLANAHLQKRLDEKAEQFGLAHRAAERNRIRVAELEAELKRCRSEYRKIVQSAAIAQRVAS